jgi:RNA polymerase sigma factor (sigma-70 family)
MKVGDRRRAHPERHASGREQFESLYRAHLRSLLAYALRRVDRPEDAADVVAETMLVAWRRRDDVPPGDDARLWLFGVGGRLLANHRRGVGRRTRLGERLGQELHLLVVPDHAPGIETNLEVRDALDQLDEDDREILRLTAWEGLEPHEIAVVLSVPPGTVRSRLHRARRRLARKLASAVSTSGERSTPGGHVDHDEQLLIRNPEDER